MKKLKQNEVICPHCQSTQNEPEGAISTNCRACGRYFKLTSAREARTVHAPKVNREVFCIKCGAPNLVAAAALSTQCIRCLHYLELGDKVVRGVQTGKLYAYDDVIFAEGCSFKGMEATGHRIEVRGRVFSKLRASAEIVAADGAQLSGELYAPVVRIEGGAKVKVQTIECARLEVSGEVEISGRLSTSEIILSDGAVFSGQLNIPEAKLHIGIGVATQFNSITCRELAIEGTMNLDTVVFTEKIKVFGGGSLNAPRICAGHIEVSPGGMLQGRVEKHVPREAPDEVAPEAKAA
jgi:cytoskeletal protein CcmA (bactofilin family)